MVIDKNYTYMSEKVSVHCYIPLYIKMHAKKNGINFSEALQEGIKLITDRKEKERAEEYEEIN